jgi:hypothetical protein
VPSLQDDPDKQVEVLEYLESKGFEACPVYDQVLVEESGDIGFAVGREFALFYHELHSEYIRFVPVICANCGHALWFNAADLPGREN